MSDAVAILTEAMRNDAESLRVIGQNVANMETVAYRREIAVMRSSFDQVSSEVRAAVAVPSGIETVTDQRPGTLKSTGETLHLALEGPGFFVVDAGQGEALTRRGDFRLDDEGRLVTHAGQPVLGTSGAIHIDGAAQIEADGSVRVAGNVVTQLRIAQTEPRAQLMALGGDLYQAAQLPEANSATRVRQGFLETSNVESVQEMVHLIETMRHFETVQRYVRGYDDMMSKAISELGKV
jgi:flagellar basal-body rod protein FlgG